MKKFMFVHLLVVLDKPMSKFGMSVLVLFVPSAFSYGFDGTTTVNLGHKITLYSQPKKILIEEMSDDHLFECLYDCLYGEHY